MALSVNLSIWQIMILQSYEYKVGFCDSDMKKLWLGYWVVNKGILWRDEMIANRMKVM